MADMGRGRVVETGIGLVEGGRDWEERDGRDIQR